MSSVDLPFDVGERRIEASTVIAAESPSCRKRLPQRSDSHVVTVMSESLPTPSSSDVFSAALALSAEERATLADALIDSLDSPTPPEIEAAWATEIERRVAAYKRDPTTAIPGEEVLAEMRAKWPS
jgi:putative addiction module component (TIGR02574 family)